MMEHTSISGHRDIGNSKELELGKRYRYWFDKLTTV